MLHSLRSRPLAICLLAISIASCTSSTPGGTSRPSGGATSGAGDAGTFADLVVQTPWPTVPASGPGVSLTLAAGNEATATLGPEGGALEATGPDGTRYRLTIPANALTFEMEIRLSPIESVDGFAPEGAAAQYGVDIGPHGLLLWEAGTLEIVPGRDADLAHAVALHYDGDGANLHRSPLSRDPARLEFAVAHFSGTLVYVGDGIYLPALPSPEPLSPEALNEAIADAIEKERAGETTPDETAATLDRLLDQYFRESLIGKVARMREDCEYGKQHLADYVGFVRQAQLLGMGHVVERYTDDVNAATLLGDVIEACWDEAREACVRYDPAQIRGLIGLVRQAQIAGRDLNVEEFEPQPCGNVGGAITWSFDGQTHREYDPYTLDVSDHYEATIYVTGQWSDGRFEDRGSRYTYHGLTRETEVGGACDVLIINRTFGEGLATDVALDIMESEAFFNASVDGTAHGNRVDCTGTSYEDQPNFGALVTCPDESGGVTGTHQEEFQQVVFDCQGSSTKEGDASGTSSFAVQGFLKLDGYGGILDILKAP